MICCEHDKLKKRVTIALNFEANSREAAWFKAACQFLPCSFRLQTDLAKLQRLAWEKAKKLLSMKFCLHLAVQLGASPGAHDLFHGRFPKYIKGHASAMPKKQKKSKTQRWVAAENLG